ncbi:MAG: ribosome maturation factor RimM [Terriglobales bacterium]
MPEAQPQAEATDPWVTLARIVKPQGRRGEMAAELFTDKVERFARLSRVYLCPADGPPRAFPLLRAWAHQGRVVLALEGVADMEAARQWVGAEVRVPAAERVVAPAGHYFISELEGCAVWDRDRALGRVQGLTDVPGAAPLLQVASPDGEILIPFAAAYVRRVDTAARRIEMELPAGMAELNQP